jgi:thioredoxin-dependent peroxiredoxin
MIQDIDPVIHGETRSMMETEMQSVPGPASKLGQRLFLGFLGTVGCLYAVIVVYHLVAPQTVSFAEKPGFMEECRQACLKYGLLTTGHVANDARAYLHKAGKTDLSEGLVSILSDRSLAPVPTMEHPLLNQPAPEFQLRNVDGQLQSLSEISGGGPVIVVFYYGYGCSHCVAQLFGLNDDLRYFQELGVQIVAISSDLPEHTAEKYKEYGKFDFPVLSDPDNAVAQLYGTHTPQNREQGEVQLHGTFMVSPEGQVAWANTGHQPFLDNKSLLLRMAEITGSWTPPATTVQRTE